MGFTNIANQHFIIFFCRCGVFSEGDVILSINDIDVKDLTFPKAHFLLRNAKKLRKITFITNKRKEEVTEPAHESSGKWNFIFKTLILGGYRSFGYTMYYMQQFENRTMTKLIWDSSA